MEFKIKDVITLDNKIEYLILDIAVLKDTKYLFVVEIDEEEMPTNNYKYLEVFEENKEITVDEVDQDDEELMKTLTSLFTISTISDLEDEEQDV